MYLTFAMIPNTIEDVDQDYLLKGFGISNFSEFKEGNTKVQWLRRGYKYTQFILLC